METNRDSLMYVSAFYEAGCAAPPLLAFDNKFAKEKLDSSEFLRVSCRKSTHVDDVVRALRQIAESLEQNTFPGLPLRRS